MNNSHLVRYPIEVSSYVVNARSPYIHVKPVKMYSVTSFVYIIIIWIT